jgi:hypothetical protein
MIQTAAGSNAVELDMKGFEQMMLPFMMNEVLS